MKISGILMAVLLGVLACATSLPPEPPHIEGRYVLESVNGDALPVLVAVVPPEFFRVARGVLVLEATGEFTDTTIVTIDPSPFGELTADTTVRAGLWSHEGSVVTVESLVFTWRGAELVRVIERPSGADLTLVYRKQGVTH